MNPHRFPLRCHAEIDLVALERNLHRIRAALPDNIRYVTVVKADAYGHGLPAVAARLMHAGVDAFAVANLAEAAALRELGSGWPVLILGALLPEEVGPAVAQRVSVTVSSDEEVERLENEARAQRCFVSVHVKIDTGMGRLGVWHERALPLLLRVRDSSYLRLAGTFTHFSAAECDTAYTDEQRSRFLRVLEKLEGVDMRELLIHADNSAGLATFQPGSPFNAVRVGLLQFGTPPGSGSLFGGVAVEPTFSFRSRVSLVKDLPAGTWISYGRTHRLARDSRVAVIAAGYADGIPRSVGNRGCVLIGGRRCPILGRVTMDQTIVDVTEIETVRAGDEVVLIGRQGTAEIPIEEFSAWDDTIPYETLCSVTKRVPRVYRT